MSESVMLDVVALEHLIGQVTFSLQRRYGHKLVRGRDGKYFYVINKKQPFYEFGKLIGDPSVIGESINEESLLFACNNDAILVFVYSFDIFTIRAEDFLVIATEANTRRLTHSGEVTYSIGLNRMTRYRRKHL